MKINLGENIRRLRREAGFTQEQLAEALGVTTGAVYKWESGRAAPELGLLVEIAEFFETSVDVLLDYGWEKSGMGQTAAKLRQYAVDKEIEAGMRLAEQALQKYPNSFRIVLESAEVYFLTMKPKNMERAAQLYQKAIQLIDQNDDESINSITIQNRIAACYCYMDRMDDGIELLKKNNINGMNDYWIGLLMSQDTARAEEALKYLSEALGSCYSQLYNICIGYANAYSALEELDKITELVLWLHELGKGLRDTNVINWMDRGDVRLFTILTEMEIRRGNEQGAADWLKKARDTARRFDAAPNYRTGAGLKFYHGSEKATSYDDMGETAVDMIVGYMADDVAGKNLGTLWEKIRDEK